MPESRVDPTAQSLIAHALEAGEELIWAGRPDPATLMRQSRRFAGVAISILVGVPVIGALVARGEKGEEWVWAVVSIVLIVGGPVAVRAWTAAARRGAAYGLTRRRAILYETGPVNSSTYIVEIGEILDPPRVKDHGDGTAYVTLKVDEGDTGAGYRVFEAIHGAHEVVALIQHLRAGSVPAAFPLPEVW